MYCSDVVLYPIILYICSILFTSFKYTIHIYIIWFFDHFVLYLSHSDRLSWLSWLLSVLDKNSKPLLQDWEIVCIYSTVRNILDWVIIFCLPWHAAIWENKTCIQGNSQTIGSTALVPIKRKGPERTGKAPTTPVKTHLGAQKIPLKTLTSHHHKLLCFFTELREPYLNYDG